MQHRGFLLSIAVLATAVSGCSGQGRSPAPVGTHAAGTDAAGTHAAGTQMAVTLQDFELKTSTVDVSAGPVTFDVTNDGPSTHEFNVDRTNLAADKLPIDGSGLFVAEDSPQLHREGSVESAALSTRHKLKLNLAAGTYVVYCDLEGHYLSGMHVTINVH